MRITTSHIYLTALAAILVTLSPCHLVTLSSSAHAQTAPAAPKPAANSGANYLGSLLTNDARDTLRNPALPPDAAAAQAAALLQFATKLNPSDLRALHLLAQSAQVVGKSELRRTTLRQIVAADSGDLVAQVQYIDALAEESQKTEDRVAFYQNMLAKTELSPQVRSEIAMRLARLAQARGDQAACRDFVNQALQLNDVNIPALREMLRLAPPPGPQSGGTVPIAQTSALAALLLADPYQPDAWFQLAHLCQSENLHDRTAQFLETAADQYQLQGATLPGDLFLELAVENAVAGNLPQAQTLAGKLADLPDAPLAALLVNELLLQEHISVSASTVAAQPKSHADEINKRLAELAKKTDDPSALADAAGAALTILPTLPPETSTWIDNYAKLVKSDDPTLIRLQGWLLVRQGDMAKAQAVLEKSADPLAQLGLARAHFADNPALAGKILQDLWNTNTAGLFALQITISARNPALRTLGYTLNDSPGAKELRPLLVRLTPALMSLHRTPQDAVYLGLNLPKPSVAPGEPLTLQVRMTNLLDHAIPVGDGGMAQSTIGLAASIRGNIVTPPQQGLYAVEDLQRVFRLESRQMMETSIRIDQGRLADVFAQHPGDTILAGIIALTAPRPLGPVSYTTGLGGQAWTVGDVQRAGIPVASSDDRDQLARDLGALTGLPQLLRIDAAATIVARNATSAPQLVAALTPLAQSKDPLVKAALLRGLPPEVPANLETALALLASDADPLVRLLWARHQTQLPTPPVAALEKFSNNEKDLIVKEWLDAQLPLLKPTTQPRK